MTPEEIEKIARALCWDAGMDPDLSLGGDKQNYLWMEYDHVVEAIEPFIRQARSEALEEAAVYFDRRPYHDYSGEQVAAAIRNLKGR